MDNLKDSFRDNFRVIGVRLGSRECIYLLMNRECKRNEGTVCKTRTSGRAVTVKIRIYSDV